MRFCSAEMPRWHPVSVSGYHIREAGSTAAQELAFTLANGFAYVEAAMAAGMEVDDFAPRLSFFFNAHIDFFEEIAKYRAARRIWARWMRDRYGASRRALHPVALPHADGGGLAHGATARGQPGPGGHRGAGRRARGDPEPAHRRLRRGARPADRARGAAGAADPAGHRRGVRRGARGRPARRIVVRRGADRRPWSEQAEEVFAHLLEAAVRAPCSKACSPASRTAGSSRRSRTPPTPSSPRSPGASGCRSGQRLRGGRRRRAVDPLDRPGVEAAQLERLAAVKQARDDDAVRRVAGPPDRGRGRIPTVNLMPALIEGRTTWSPWARRCGPSSRSSGSTPSATSPDHGTRRHRSRAGAHGQGRPRRP